MEPCSEVVSRIEPSYLEDKQSDFLFCVHTTPRGFNGGRAYYFRAASEAERDLWIGRIHDVIAADRVRQLYTQFSRLQRFQSRCRAVYESAPLQNSVAALIAANFILSAAAAEIQPAPGSSAEAAFSALEIFFTGVYLLPLSLSNPQS